MLDSTQPVSGSGPIVIGNATNASVMLRGPVDDGAAVCCALEVRSS